MWSLLLICSVLTLNGANSSDTKEGMKTKLLQPPARGSCRDGCGHQVSNCSCASNCTQRGDCCHDYESYCSSTAEMFTGQPSCLDNCGRHIGSCSCTSSCRSSGSCCHDYNYHCSSGTTYPPATIKSGPSCRYNCGYNFGSCSCSSSCRYYGNCCYDYYSYCDSGTSTPTSQPSCWNSCGYNLGSCSCSSSCRYYGNCCYDYYSYCSSGSTPSPATTSGPSCRYNCGLNLGSCSCSSSCRYYGNCCYDYYSYCETTTPSAQTCGGVLFGTGNFSSPNYPGYYQDNTYCVWQLRASGDHRIILAVRYIQLENCCSCDYISVYDGPSTSSRYLGKLCNNSLDSFQSSSKYMTVVFRTDSSVVGRGFRAEFISTLPSSSGKVECSSDNMKIVIGRHYLNSLGYDGHNLYLNDRYCRPTISSSQVTFNFQTERCGTIKRFDAGRVVYSNILQAYPTESVTASSGITRREHLKLNVDCIMDQDSVAQIIYRVHNDGISSIVGTGSFNTSMDFYTSSSFYDRVTQAPYEVTLNQRLYVQVDLRRADGTLVLFIDTCVAAPSRHDFQTRPYYLVRRGCAVDNTYSAYVSGSRSYARFTFTAFQFLQGSESVYIQCKVLLCRASDYNSPCRRGCTKRKARDVESDHASQSVVLGPIQLKDLDKKEEGTHEEEKV